MHPQPYRRLGSNTLIGYLNLLTLVASIPVIAAGLWVAHGSSSTCESALQVPLLTIGFIVLVVSLAGFIGGCYHVTCALWLYLLAVLLLVVALLGMTVFGLAVTAGGGGRQVPGRPYREFRVTDYSAWLQKHAQLDRYWRPALACVVGSRACSKITTWTPIDYLQHNLTPIQDEDCYRWNNAANILCYQCDSCKAGVLEQLRRDWHNITILNVIVLVMLIAIYSCGCCAFRNARRAGSEYPYGVNRMSKIYPRWDYFW
ncbi:hypothetical protein PR202_ga08139 [Eleusine coracana subsp. coracana]|uniref:Senescence-associated protein n=1 Tax=Eleusine coracana subsp. coracana TaxID=191504 RepID=A0AAV5C0J9_ELECO|nr:hypothetical protein PR202_ga08139 [Eleusine coracana subsp. coracana]